MKVSDIISRATKLKINKSIVQRLDRSDNNHNNNHNIDKKCEKCIIVLDVLNELLIALNKKKINNIIEFKNIRKDNLLKPECKDVLSNYIEKLALLFKYIDIYYKHNNNSKYYTITVIKYIIKSCGYLLKPHIEQNDIILYSIYCSDNGYWASK